MFRPLLNWIFTPLMNNRGEVAVVAPSPNVNLEEPAFEPTPEPDPTPAPEPTPEPVVDEDPEFEIEAGKKYKRSEMLAWQKSHGMVDRVKPLSDLDEFLSKPGNESLQEAFVELVKTNDQPRIASVLDLLRGKAPVAPAAAEPAPVAEDWEGQLDLTDPSVKALFGAFKGLKEQFTGQLKDLQGFKDETVKQREDRQRADSIKSSEDKFRQDTDSAWTEHKYDELLARLPEDTREETSTLLRQMMMATAIGSKGQIPLSQVGKTLHGRMTRMIDGVIKAYAEGNKTVPPQGGGKGSVTTPEPPLNFDSPKLTERMASRMTRDEV